MSINFEDALKRLHNKVDNLVKPAQEEGIFITLVEARALLEELDHCHISSPVVKNMLTEIATSLGDYDDGINSNTRANGK